jgi:hypothetical protein
MGVFAWQPAPLRVLLIALEPGNKPFALRLPPCLRVGLVWRTGIRGKRTSQPTVPSPTPAPSVRVVAGSVARRQGKALRSKTFGQRLRFWQSASRGSASYRYDGATTFRLSTAVPALPWLVVRTRECPGRAGGCKAFLPAVEETPPRRVGFRRRLSLVPVFRSPDGERSWGSSVLLHGHGLAGHGPATRGPVVAASALCARSLFVIEVRSESARTVCIPVVDCALPALSCF